MDFVRIKYFYKRRKLRESFENVAGCVTLKKVITYSKCVQNFYISRIFDKYIFYKYILDDKKKKKGIRNLYISHQNF